SRGYLADAVKRPDRNPAGGIRIVTLPLSLSQEPTLEQCEEVIERGIATFVVVGAALLAIRQRKLYRDAGYTRFEDYCRERWSLSGRHAERLMSASAIVERLKSRPSGRLLPPTEAHARPLSGLCEEEQVAAWGEVIQAAQDRGLTAGLVKEIVLRRL